MVIFTQHSVTTEFEQAAEQIIPSLEAMRVLAVEGCQVVVTYPNNDAGGQRNIAELEKLATEKLENIQIHKSLGRYNYHGVLSLCAGAGRGL